MTYSLHDRFRRNSKDASIHFSAYLHKRETSAAATEDLGRKSNRFRDGARP